MIKIAARPRRGHARMCWPCECPRPLRAIRRKAIRPAVPGPAAGLSRPESSGSAALIRRRALRTSRQASNPGLRAPGNPACHSTAARPIRRAPTRSSSAEDAIAKQQADLDRTLAQAHKVGCAGEGFFCAVLGPVAAMRTAHLADPPDARQSRPHDERSRTAQERRQRPGQAQRQRPDRATGAKQLRLAIHRGRPRRPARRASSKRCWAAAHDRQSERQWRAGRHLSHGLRAHLRRLLFPGFLLDRAEPVPRRRAQPASGCARRPKSRSTPIAIPARRSSRRSRRAARHTPRCPTLSAIARNWSQAAHAGSRARAGRKRCATPTTPARWKAATSSSPTRTRRRSRKSQAPSHRRMPTPRPSQRQARRIRP